MARVIPTPTSSGPVGPFEKTILEAFRDGLPEGYLLAPNFQLKQKGQDALEYDVVVIAPHAIYVVEAKEWFGKLTGDDSEWLVNSTPKKCPFWLLNLKCKVLKTELGALGQSIYVAPLLVVPDGTQISLGGNWATWTRNLTPAIGVLQKPQWLPKSGDIRSLHEALVKQLQGSWGSRQRGKRTRIAGYEVVETLFSDSRTGEFIARKGLIPNDPSRYRIRTWRLNTSLPPKDIEKQKAVVRRPSEAVAKIGWHPNLLPVVLFDFNPDDNEFYEVTEWPEWGTLHGFLENRDRERLTLRERLEIADGVAAALEAVHAHDVVHRNVCPETILIGFDRKPHLTDFDRAYVENRETVFEATEGRIKNRAYLPPELENATDYDFDTCSDMYSLGVLLYRLLIDRVPFENPKAARTKHGRPDEMPSKVREGLPPGIDDLILGLLRVDDFKARPTAAEVLRVLRPAIGASTGAASQTASKRSAPPPPTLEPGAILEGKWRVDAVLGQGNFARVLKVFNFDHKSSYAMKVLTNAENQDLAPQEFVTMYGKVPAHPNLARVIWQDRLSQPLNHPFVVYEFIDGETLQPYCEGARRFPWSDIRRIGIELLNGLEALHDAGVLHRDVKPANIMLEFPSFHAKWIDFNISASVGAASGGAGTPRYWAPDRGQPEWLPNADLFSLGVVLYELALNRHPFPNDRPENGRPYDPRDIVTEFRVSEELAAFLLKAVQPKAAERFQTAAEMRTALEAVSAMVAPSLPFAVLPGSFPGIKLEAAEATRKNYNPYVTRLLTLFSQAKRTNSGTRGLDEIANLTYVPTLLDEKLAPEIASGHFRLVIVTGNAGDGKTAFLQKVEKLFVESGARMQSLLTGNGSRWDSGGIHYETNYDGSQDEGDRSNDDVLDAFFSPFAGDTLNGLEGKNARVIAINEGRLLDFLTHSEHRDRFGGLRRFVLESREGTLGVEKAILVNLNLRAITAGGPHSLVEKQLVAMLKPAIWQPCDECALKERCPIKHNVESLRDPASGPAARERLRRLFELVHLRLRAHITMRDLRSALSWMLLRDCSCDDIARLLSRTDTLLTNELASLTYVNAFADSENEGGGAIVAASGEEDRTVDRLVLRLKEADVGLVSSPSLDRALNHDPRTAVPWMTFEHRPRTAWDVMMTLSSGAPRPGDAVDSREQQRVRRMLIAKWRRWAYFERRDDGWRSMLPYRSTALLERIGQPENPAAFKIACQELKNRIVDAVSISEGIRNPGVLESYLVLKITEVRDGTVKSYRLFAKELFEIRVGERPALGRYVESSRDSVELVHSSGSPRLKVSLDLLEMLELIRNGYRPTATELQGLFVNLVIFRNELLATPFSRILVTRDDREFYEISAEGRSDGVHLSAQKRPGFAGPAQEAL